MTGTGAAGRLIGRLNAGIGFVRSLAIYHDPVALYRWRRFYALLLDPGDLVFDVGAHVGTRSRAMRGAGAKVVALEPQAAFAAFLRRTLPRDVTVLEMAAGQTPGATSMAISSRHPTVSTLSNEFVRDGREASGFEHVRWDRRQEVDVVTLDALIARFGLPRYAKIDVEGGEREVLSGLSSPVPLLSVEYLPALPHLALDLAEQLEDMGYSRFNVVAGEGGAFLWDGWRGKAELSAWLGDLPPDALSGDIYARRT
ncbi:MAG: FkbM family methyltransferase [Pseudomonadota bacterium]